MNDTQTTQEIITNILHEQTEAGNIVIRSIDGLVMAPIAEFVMQPADGILYDLNRGEAVTMSHGGDRLVNDYAVAKVIRHLKDKIKSLQEASDKYWALEEYGVDNWNGYEDAMESLNPET